MCFRAIKPKVIEVAVIAFQSLYGKFSNYFGKLIKRLGKFSLLFIDEIFWPCGQVVIFI